MKLTLHDDCWEAAASQHADRALIAGLRWYKVHASNTRAYGVAERFPLCDVIYRPADPPGLSSLGAWMEHTEFRDVRLCAEAQVRVSDIRPRGNLWIEGINEPVLHTEAEAVWYGKLEALRSVLLGERGLHAVVGNFATGNPEPELFRLWLQTYIANGGRRDALIGIHEYGWRALAPAADEFNMLGHRRLARAAGSLASGFRWAVTECGMDKIQVGGQWVGGSWVEQRMTQAEYWRYLLAYSAELDKEPAVVCACIYSYGAPGNWEDWDMEGAAEFNGYLLDAIRATGPAAVSKWYAVTASDGLYLRSGAGKGYSILAGMSKGARVRVILQPAGDWWQVEFGALQGWCSRHYLAESSEPVRTDPPTASAAMLQLAPEYGIDPAIGLAVMRVEAGGVAFGKDGRMIIRFEPHILRPRVPAARFDEYYMIGVGGLAGWQGDGHRYRMGPGQPWQKFHGVQASEWQALAIARSIDDEAALRSISMGAGQVMGFNHRAAGHASARAMYDALNGSAVAQVRAMLDYCKSRGLIGALRSGDFLAFARAYNGSGQAERYARLIEQAARLNGWRPV